MTQVPKATFDAIRKFTEPARQEYERQLDQKPLLEREMIRWRDRLLTEIVLYGRVTVGDPPPAVRAALLSKE